MIDISIVYVNYKMKEDIEKSLLGLVKDINQSDLLVAVTVMDNSNNADGIKEMLSEKFPKILYINSGGNIGFGKANNIGLKKTQAKYYFILNPDTKINDNSKLLKSLYDYMEVNPKVGIVGPKQLNLDGSLQFTCHNFPKFLAKPARQMGLASRHKYFKKIVDDLMMKDYDHKSERNVDWLIGSALFVRHKATEKVGLFDDRYFMYFEDCDWCRRMWVADWQVKYLPSVVLTHGHRRASAKVPGILAVIKNPVTRIHIKSWLLYFWKWKFKKTKFY